LSINGEVEVVVKVEGKRVVIETVSRDLERVVNECVKVVLNVEVELFSGELEETWRWVSEDYARRKLGLLSRESS
jgi:hypothetical protein